MIYKGEKYYKLMTDNIHKRFPSGGWNVKCGKCNDNCSPFISEVIKEFPEHKGWLETWKVTEKKDNASSNTSSSNEKPCEKCGLIFLSNNKIIFLPKQKFRRN